MENIILILAVIIVFGGIGYSLLDSLKYLSKN